MIVKLILFPILWGIALHQTESLTSHIPPGWSNLTNYSIGVQGSLLIFIMFLRALGFSDKEIFRIVLAFQVAFLSVGIGVAGGWWMDAIVNKHLEKKKLEKVKPQV